MAKANVAAAVVDRQLKKEISVCVILYVSKAKLIKSVFDRLVRREEERYWC